MSDYVLLKEHKDIHFYFDTHKIFLYFAIVKNVIIKN